MNVLGFRNVKIERLCLSGDFRQRLDSPRIAERARSIERVGVLFEPMVRWSDMQVIYGEDRIASCIRLGRTEVRCKVVECTDAELHEIRTTENVNRRHDTESQRAGLLRLLELYEEQIKKDPKAVPEVEPNRGRQRSARGLARIRIANEAGIKPESVRRSEIRARQSVQKKALKERNAEAAKPHSPLNTLGMDIEDSFVLDVMKVDELLHNADSALRRAQVALDAISKGKLPCPSAKLQRLVDDIHAAAVVCRGLRPVALCPYCKGLPGLQEKCSSCLQTGWVGAAQAGHIPKPLWTEGAQAIVSVAGQYTLVSDYLASMTEPAPEPVVVREDAEEFFA